MSRDEDEKDGALRLSLDDSRKMRPPNKKKFDEDMDSLTSQIKEKEAELDNVRQAVVEVKRLKALRTECFNKRRQIVTDLDRINKEIPDRMKRLNEIEASLYYKNEDKINSAIQRLEWNLSVKTYKLTEEKKIVSEIDSLKRSKKNLVQYMTLKQEISEIRDRQKALRDGRDTFTKEFNRLRAQEEAVRSKNRSLATIKREIDGLYETRRQTNANFKQQRGEFNEAKEKHRKESWKKKADERKVYEERKPEWMENETERLPHDSDLQTCLSLTSCLSRLLPSVSDNPSYDSLSPASSQDGGEPADELEDGQGKLLRRSEDSDTLDLSQSQSQSLSLSQGGGGGGIRRLSKRNKKFKKLAMEKKVSLPQEVVDQLASLRLPPPTFFYEVTDVLEQLDKKRSFFEKEQQQCEATSDAGISGISGISGTESAVFAMSRQASKTESCDGLGQDGSAGASSRPDDSVYTALLQQQQEDRGGHSVKQEVVPRGAVGGRKEDGEDDWVGVASSDSPNSDSTLEGGDSGDGGPVAAWPSTKPPAMAAVGGGGRREMRRSLAISISDSTDSSSSLQEQSVRHASSSSSSLIVEEEIPGLVDSGSQTSFLALGVSGGNGGGGNSGGGGGIVSKQAASPSSSVNVRAHLPLTKTFSIVIPQDSTTIHHNQQQQQQMQKVKSYASSVVGRARSFSEVAPKKTGPGNPMGVGVRAGGGDGGVHKSTDFPGGGGGGRSQGPTVSGGGRPQGPTVSGGSLPQGPTVSPKPIQPPSSLSLSPSTHTHHHLTPTLAPKSSLRRSRTLTPTITRTWTEVRDRHRKSSGNSSGSGSGGGGGGGGGDVRGNTTPSGSFSSGKSPYPPTTPTSKSTTTPKTPISASLSSSSALPSPHKSSLSPRLSYPLQSTKPSPTTPQPIILIGDDKNFPPLGQKTTGNSANNTMVSRRNSSLSTKSSTGSTSFSSLHDRDTTLNNSTTTTHPSTTTTNPTTTTTTTSDNNNNNNNSFSYLDVVAQGLPPSPSAPHTHPPPTTHRHHHPLKHSTQASSSTTVMDSNSNTNTNLSTLPKGDKSSTEKWVESSMAFAQLELSAPEDGPTPSPRLSPL